MEHFWNNFFSVFGFISGLIFTVIFFHAVEKAYKKFQRYRRPQSVDNTKSPQNEFLDDWCNQSPKAEIVAYKLYDAYTIWCREKGYEPYTQTRFGRHMVAMKFERVCRGPCSYVGLELNEKALAAIQAKSQPGQ